VVNGTVAVSSAVSISETSTQQLTFKNKELCKAGKYRQLRISQAMTSCLRPLQYHREREDHEKPSEKQQIMFLLSQLTLSLTAVMLELTIASPAVTNNQNSVVPQAAIVEFARVRIIFS
jgi:hypothetical protein